MIWKAILLVFAVMVLSAAVIAMFVAAACFLDKPNQIEGEKMLQRIIDEYDKENEQLK